MHFLKKRDLLFGALSLAIVLSGTSAYPQTRSCEQLFRSREGSHVFFDTLLDKVEEHVQRLVVRHDRLMAQFLPDRATFHPDTVAQLKALETTRPQPYEMEKLDAYRILARAILRSEPYLAKLANASIPEGTDPVLTASLRQAAIDAMVEKYVTLNLNGNPYDNALRRIEREHDPRVSSKETIAIASEIMKVSLQLSSIQKSGAYQFLKDRNVTVTPALTADVQALAKASESEAAFEAYVQKLIRKNRP